MKVFTTIMANVISVGAPSALQLAENAQRFSHQDISLRIEPFTTMMTDIQPTEMSPQEVLRLTFEAEGERYRLETPTLSTLSANLTPLTQNPRLQFTAVHLPNFSYLTILSTVQYNSWMSRMRD